MCLSRSESNYKPLLRGHHWYILHEKKEAYMHRFLTCMLKFFWQGWRFEGAFHGCRSPCRTSWPFCWNCCFILWSSEICIASKTFKFIKVEDAVICQILSLGWFLRTGRLSSFVNAMPLMDLCCGFGSKASDESPCSRTGYIICCCLIGFGSWVPRNVLNFVIE